MKTLTKIILTTIIASSVMLFLGACGKKEPKTASEAAAEATTQMEEVANSDEVQEAEQGMEEATEAAEKKVDEVTD